MYGSKAYFKKKQKNVNEEKAKRNSKSVLKMAAGGLILTLNTLTQLKSSAGVIMFLL